MNDPGLSNRLRQHSRRSGVAIGITMAITIAVGILTSAWMFGQLEPLVADITGYDEETPVPAEELTVAEVDSSGTSGGNQTTDTSSSASSSTAQPTIAAPAPTPTLSQFEITHRSNPNFTVNFRPGPSVSSGNPITSLSPNTPMRWLGDQGQDEEGLLWLLMETEDGIEGWIREVDAVEVSA